MTKEQDKTAAATGLVPYGKLVKKRNLEDLRVELEFRGLEPNGVPALTSERVKALKELETQRLIDQENLSRLDANKHKAFRIQSTALFKLIDWHLDGFGMPCACWRPVTKKHIVVVVWRCLHKVGIRPRHANVVFWLIDTLGWLQRPEPSIRIAISSNSDKPRDHGTCAGVCFHFVRYRSSHFRKSTSPQHSLTVRLSTMADSAALGSASWYNYIEDGCEQKNSLVIYACY